MNNTEPHHTIPTPLGGLWESSKFVCKNICKPLSMNAEYFYCYHRYTKSPSSFTALPCWVWTPLQGVPRAQSQPHWTDLIRDHSQQRQTLTSLVLLPAFFCSFSCYKTRNHLSKSHNNGQSCYLHLQLKPKSGLRKNEDVKLFSECRTKWWNHPWAWVHEQECLSPAAWQHEQHGVWKIPGRWTLLSSPCNLSLNDPPSLPLAVPCSPGSRHSFSHPPQPNRVSHAGPSNSRPNWFPSNTSILEASKEQLRIWEQLWTPSESWVWTKALTEGLASWLRAGWFERWLSVKREPWTSLQAPSQSVQSSAPTHPQNNSHPGFSRGRQEGTAHLNASCWMSTDWWNRP